LRRDPKRKCFAQIIADGLIGVESIQGNERVYWTPIFMNIEDLDKELFELHKYFDPELRKCKNEGELLELLERKRVYEQQIVDKCFPQI